MPVAEPGGVEPAERPELDVRDVHVQYDVGIERMRDDSLDENTRDPRRGVEVPATPGRKGHRDGGEPQQPSLHRGRHRSRVDHVITEIRAGVDSGHHDVRFRIQQTGDRQVHAVGGCSIDADEPVLRGARADGRSQGQ